MHRSLHISSLCPPLTVTQGISLFFVMLLKKEAPQMQAIKMNERGDIGFQCFAVAIHLGPLDHALNLIGGKFGVTAQNR